MNLLGVYLTFDGKAEEALRYYSEIFNTPEPSIMRFEDMPEKDRLEMGIEGNYEGKIMHGSITINKTDLSASDMMTEGEVAAGPNKGYQLTYTTSSVEENEKLYDRMIKDGGEAIMPPEKVFWSPSFAVLNDKYGIQWMIMVYVPEEK